MEGMERKLAYEMTGIGIKTMEDLAEQSVDELMVIDGMDEEWAAQLIMTLVPRGLQTISRTRASGRSNRNE